MTSELVEEMPRRKRGDDAESAQETVPVTVRLPTWMLTALEDASDTQQRPLADVIKRLLARALRAGWATEFEATPLTDYRASPEGEPPPDQG